MRTAPAAPSPAQLLTALVSTFLVLTSLVFTLPATTAAGQPAAGTRTSRPAAVVAGGPSYALVPVAAGLNGPAGFTVSDAGKIWYLERGTGEVRLINPATGGNRLILDISGVDGSGERGALGVALHPDFPAKPFVYVYVTRTDGGDKVNELLRFRIRDGRKVGTQVLFKWAVNSATNHNGGRIVFGPEGKLWIVTGDNAVPSTSQQVTNLRGKVLRVNPDGTIPASNPFGTRIYAFGIRISFGFAFDPETGRPWETENGPSCNDEINLIVKGGNFAWGPNQSCPANATDATASDTNQDGPLPRRFPKTRFAVPLGITGAAFCAGCGLGSAVAGDLVFSDVNTGAIRAIDLNASRNGFDAASRILFATGTSILSMEAGPNGRIYVSSPTGIWRIVRT